MRTQGEDSPEDRGRAGEAAARLAQDTAQLARHEILAVRSEIRAALRRIGAGGALLGAAGVCGLLALWSAHEALLRSLEPVLPGARAPAALGAVYATGAVTLGCAAGARMRSAGGVPERASDRAHEGRPDRF
ncbi:phage holin family protein [Streptomyces nodosus]|uniref:phage holin family protein n=2 Tax=Streptomyces TaxID=1883 RepID=UPI0036E5992B